MPCAGGGLRLSLHTEAPAQAQAGRARNPTSQKKLKSKEQS